MVSLVDSKVDSQVDVQYIQSCGMDRSCLMAMYVKVVRMPPHELAALFIAVPGHSGRCISASANCQFTVNDRGSANNQLLEFMSSRSVS